MPPPRPIASDLTGLIPAPRAVAGDIPIPFPPRNWGVTQARAAVYEAAFWLGLPSTDEPDLSVVRAASTVVFHAHGQALKVYPPGTDLRRIRQVSELLHHEAVALTPHRLIETSFGPVAAAPWTVGQDPPSWAEMGRLLRTLHSIPAPHLPRWAPMSRIATSAALLPNPTDAAVMLAARDRLDKRLAALAWPLGQGLIHGDVSLDNALRRADGRPALIDLDFISRGPRGYDLSCVARRHDRGELSHYQYAQFCNAYGYDISAWTGRIVLDEMISLSVLGFNIWQASATEADLSWASPELDRWR